MTVSWIVAGLGVVVSLIGYYLTPGAWGYGILGFGIAHIVLGILDMFRNRSKQIEAVEMNVSNGVLPVETCFYPLNQTHSKEKLHLVGLFSMSGELHNDLSKIRLNSTILL